MNTFVPLENPEEVVSILSQISIFGGVTDDQQNEIFRRLEIGTVQKGQFVFQKGDEPSHIYIVERGLIELFIPDKEHTIEKKRLGVGECFGQVTSTNPRCCRGVGRYHPHCLVPTCPVPVAPRRHRPVCTPDDEHRP